MEPPQRKQLATRAASKGISGNYSYAPLLRLPYNDLSGIIQVWSESCDSMAVYEHQADESVKTTHVHMIMLGCKYKTSEPLKRLYYKMFPNTPTSEGNGLWSWSNKDHPEPNIQFITYMSKGVYAPKYVKNIPTEKVEELRGMWSEPTPKTLTQTFINSKEPKLTNHTLMLKVVNLILEPHQDKPEEFKKNYLANLEDRLWLYYIRKIIIQEKQMKFTYKVCDIFESCQMYYNKNSWLSDCLYIINKKRGK